MVEEQKKIFENVFFIICIYFIAYRKEHTVCEIVDVQRLF